MYGFVNKFVVRKTGRKLGIYGVILAHQKLETSSIAYALDLAGWALRICSVVKYIEALTLSDWAFAHKAPPPPRGAFSFSTITGYLTGGL